MRTRVSTLALVALCGCFEGEAVQDAPDDEPFAAAQPAPDGVAPSPEAGVAPSPGADGAPAPEASPAASAPRGKQAYSAPSEREASRFLVQASFGGSAEDVAAVRQLGLEGWILRQSRLPVRPMTDRILSMDDPHRHELTDLFWNYALENEDQLRQRVAYALSQIVVVSAGHEIFYQAPAVFTRYADILQEEAFGNYADLVRRVSMTPAMGSYLSSAGNRKHDPARGVRPDENFAREVMQLFTIGLEELEMDGTSTGRPTYTNEDIMGLASIFTGLSWDHDSFMWPKIAEVDPTRDMVAFPRFHEPGAKSFLGTTVASTTDPTASVRLALDHLLSHDNLAPFVSKQLIQRLVTSNPSSGYVLRVATAFETGRYVMGTGRAVGEGRRGDMMATVSAILLDEEARSAAAAADPGFGRVREPILRFAQLARALRDDEGAPATGAPTDVGPLRRSRHKNILAQQAFEPPSVFGFTRPGYIAPGTWSGEAGLVAPALSLSGGTNAIGYVEFMGRVASNRIPSGGFFKLDYEDTLLPLSGDPAALVDALDELVTYGTMAQATKQRIVRALNTVGIEGDDETQERQRLNRVKLAVLMTATAPAYAVQR